MNWGDRGRSGIFGVGIFYSEGAVIPGDTDNFLFCAVGTVNRIFGGVKEGAGAVLNITFDPLAF